MKRVAAPVLAASSNLNFVRIVDAMCGAGGLGYGLDLALRERGLPAQSIAINHDEMAVATHLANMGHYVRHYANDIRGFDPRHAVPAWWNGGWDIFACGWPCEPFSRAAAGRPRNDQLRMHAWEVQRWHAVMRGRWLVGENVPEWPSKFGPTCVLAPGHRGRCLDETEAEEHVPCCDQFIKRKKGQYFFQWKQSLEAVGWNIEMRVLNAADFGAATTRERLIILGRRDGGPIPWPQATHAQYPEKVTDLFGYGRKPWRSAAEVIDIDNLGVSMWAQRSRAWSQQTLRRIARAANKHWGPLGPLAVVAMTELGLPRDCPEYMAAVASVGSSGPFHVSVAALAHWLEPLHLGQGGGAEFRRVSVDPLNTIATAGAVSLVQPLLVQYNGQSETVPLKGRPLPTITTRDRFAKLVAVLIPKFGERPTQLPRFHTLDAPLPTVTSEGAGRLVQIRLGVGASGEVNPARVVFIEGQPYVLDLFFRMLANTELAAAMGFPPDFVFVGSDSQVKSQIGRAVAVPLAQAVFGAILDSDAALRRRLLGDVASVKPVVRSAVAAD